MKYRNVNHQNMYILFYIDRLPELCKSNYVDKTR